MKTECFKILKLNNFNTKLVPEILYILIHLNHMELSKNMLFTYQNHL